MGGDAPAALVVHFAPMLSQWLESKGSEVDQFIAGKSEEVFALIEALRKSLEPFPQFQEAQLAMDRLSQQGHVEGLSAAVVVLLRAFCELPFDQRCDVASVILSSAMEQLVGLVHSLIADYSVACGSTGGNASPEAAMHRKVVCDACGVSPICGPRFKCSTCPDYDLCGSCYLRKDDLHDREHQFDCVTHPADDERGNACGWAEQGKGCGKDLRSGWGDGCGKGRTKERGWKCDSWSSPSSSGSSSSSDSDRRVLPTCPRKAKKKMKMEKKAAKKAWKQARRDAEHQCKMELKAAKRAYVEAKKAYKQKKRARKDGALNAAPSTETTSEGNSFFQVLADMGFDNIELNAQLLEKNGNNLQAVLDVLLGPVGSKSQ